MRILKTFYILQTLVLVFISPSARANSYDDAYRAEFSAGRVKDLVEYIGFLSRTPPGESRDAERRRLEALKYFLTTGGKGGFLPRSATAEERRTLTKAVAIMAVLEDSQSGSSSLDVVAIKGKDIRAHRWMT